MQLKPIDQQVVAVVGASSGIGRETALRFARRGARVVAAARSQPGLDSLVEEIRRTGGQATAVAADVSDFDQVKGIADRAVAEYGHLDTWVHAAAVLLVGSFEQTTPEEFRRVVDVNLLGQAYGAMAALPHLRRAGQGALIHVSSVEARRAIALQSAYSASKHGVRGMVKALRIELEKQNAHISVTEIVPATVDTPLFNKARTKIGVEPALFPPVYKPEVVADAIVYAAEHPTAEIVVGGAGFALIQAEKVASGLLDTLQRWLAFRLQRSNRPKSEDSPNNLYEPIAGYDRVRGDYAGFTFPSIYTWLVTHAAARRISMAGLTLVATALVSTRLLKGIGGPGLAGKLPYLSRKRRRALRRLIGLR